MKKFSFYRQLDQMDCGPTCLRMISKYHGRSYSAERIRQKGLSISREGISLLSLSDAAEKIGFKTLIAKISFSKLEEQNPVPFIAYWRQKHFVVVYKFSGSNVWIADPSYGLVKYTKQRFLEGWLESHLGSSEEGVVLLLEPTVDFYSDADDKPEEREKFSFLFNYLKPYQRFFLQLVFGMFIGSLLQLVLPFLTQSIVDIGINQQNISFINLILIAQLMLFLSRTALDFIRGWILLHIGSRINIAILSDFLIKLMKLPIAYFDNRKVGDILQRISDHKRIETFLTTSVLTAFFSSMNLVIFGGVLALYSLQIFAVFFVASAMYTLWVVFFLRKRKNLDYKFFDQMSVNSNSLIQIITGMQEIKLHNSEHKKRWDWERIQAKVFKLNIQKLTLNQYQQAGSTFINELKNIFITYLAAKAVINGEITLGMMLAIQYIIGQLNAPIADLISFTHTTQDAKISFERLREIHQRKEEEDTTTAKTLIPPQNQTIVFNNVCFQYDGARSRRVLQDISLVIPKFKTTAIVGDSGSGKTTLLKLLLRFYEPTSGEIKLGSNDFSSYSNQQWRRKCGAVMQDGFIFSDTIANNVAVGPEKIDHQRIVSAVQIANIKDHIESLPLGYNTKIGNDGMGISQGQRQRILIARAVYKDPDFIFLDEATNSLDSNNEKIIIENLNTFLKGRTVVVVAHRLTTVMNADQIIVLEKGRIVETGTHQDLILNRGQYYTLIKKQLELNN